MRLVMLGTGPFAVPTFRGLYNTQHSVVALVTAPIRLRHGKRLESVNPMRDVAHEHGTAILDPHDINSEESQAELSRYKADLLVVCDYGQILSSATLATARLGGVNLHASLLPKYRGAAPINWALYRGETETGVTVIHMTPRVDAGPCIAQARCPIDADVTAEELAVQLAQIGAWLARRTIDSLEAGRLEALPQNPTLVSRAPRLKKTDGLIDWNRSAPDIKNQIRAMLPWPKSYTYWHRANGRRLRLIIGPVSLLDPHLAPAVPGTVLEASANRLIVAAGQGTLVVANLQPAGKRSMSAEDFLRGYPIQAGDRFGPE